jgi:hypothetical protein
MKKHQIKKDRKKRGVVTQPENFKYLYTTECWQNTKGAVMEMAELSAAKGARMVLLIAPEMSEAVKDFREGYPYWYINEMLEGIKHNNIVVIDPIREFSRLDLKKKEIANWTYPNAQANDIIANYVIQELQKSGIKLCN